MHGLVCTVPGAAEPVSLADVKTFLRITDTDQDGVLAGLIAEARERFEEEADRALVLSTWRLTLDSFFSQLYRGANVPERWSELSYGYQYDYIEGAWGSEVPGPVIRLPRAPCQNVTSITYLDQTGTLQTLANDGSAYQLTTDREPALVQPTYGTIWPITRRVVGAVKLTYTAGYGPVTTVAAAIAAGTQTVTPASMTGINVGTVLTVDSGTVQERVGVTATGSTTFTAVFANAHNTNTRISAVPDRAVQTLKRIVGFLYENRWADRDMDAIETGVQNLIRRHWTGWI